MYGGGAAVVSVRDVDAVDAGEGFPDAAAVRLVRNDPDAAAYITLEQEVAGRLRSHRFRNDRTDHGVVAVAEEDRTGLGAAGIHVADPVQFLFREGVFMFFNDVFVVIVDRGAGDDAGLRPSVHGLCIEIVTGGTVLYEAPAGDPAAQQGVCMPVDAVVIEIDILRESGLRAVNAQKRAGVGGNVMTRLRPGIYIIGKSCDLRFQPGCGPEGGKRPDISHESILLQIATEGTTRMFPAPVLESL